MNQVQTFLIKFWKGVGSELANEFITRVSNGEWPLVQLPTVDPSSYSSPHTYLADALCVDIVRKLKVPGLDDERCYKAAVDTFWAAEAQCALTNTLVDRLLIGPVDPTEAWKGEFLSVWRSCIKRVLGTKIPARLDPRFSAGSTLSDKGQETTIPDKLSSIATAYTDMVDIARHSVEGSHTEHRLYNPKVVRANRFFTVPKDNQKDRGCCVEASEAVRLQLAVGRGIRDRYNTYYGVDLANMQSYHRTLARLASNGELELATIDLSNASDTVARKLVRALLPEPWYDLMNSLRAKSSEIEGKTVHLQKFSSMGNGFTFELETLLFRTLCEALGAKMAYVYGDDIIVDSCTAKAVLGALRAFGFTPNSRKTFCEGHFRESCGGDYFMGEPVRAHFLKRLPDEPSDWIALANGLRRLDPELKRLHAAWRFCVDQLPTPARVFGPEWLGDLVVYDPSACPSVHIDKQSGTETYFWTVWKPVQFRKSLSRYGAAAALDSLLLGCPPSIAPRDSIKGYKRGKVVAYGMGETPFSIEWWTRWCAMFAARHL